MSNPVVDWLASDEGQKWAQARYSNNISNGRPQTVGSIAQYHRQGAVMATLEPGDHPEDECDAWVCNKKAHVCKMEMPQGTYVHSHYAEDIEYIPDLAPYGSPA